MNRVGLLPLVRWGSATGVSIASGADGGGVACLGDSGSHLVAEGGERRGA